MAIVLQNPGKQGFFVISVRNRECASLSIMQNKPNFQKSQMNVSIYLQTGYENKSDWTIGKNKPNQGQSKPILEKMNVNFCAAWYYENKQKALKKPPLLEVNSEPLRKDL